MQQARKEHGTLKILQVMEFPKKNRGSHRTTRRQSTGRENQTSEIKRGRETEIKPEVRRQWSRPEDRKQ
jgi:hypothetical protein